jgi:hypothetical protein
LGAREYGWFTHHLADLVGLRDDDVGDLHAFDHDGLVCCAVAEHGNKFLFFDYWML